MLDPRAVVPYHDPHDPTFPSGEQLHQYFQDHNPTLGPNISLLPTNYFQNARFQQPQVHAEHSPAAAPALDLFEDRSQWSDAVRNNAAVSKAVAEPSGTAVGPHATAEEGSSASSENVTVILSETPPTYSCKCSQVLRVIVHTKGNHTAKLELHGKLGVISHGKLENSYFHRMPHGARPYELFDFTKKSLEQVKEFLQQYMEEKKRGGYVMMEDPLMPYYKAISVGIVEDLANSEDFFDESPSGGNEVNQTEIHGPAVLSRRSSTLKRPSFTEQRERAAKMTVLDIAGYFHLPIKKASERLIMCQTVIKKICRRAGVRRWPYRKVKSLDERIRS